MIAFARDTASIEWPVVRRVSSRRCPMPPRSLRMLLDGWLLVAGVGYLAALAGLGL